MSRQGSNDHDSVTEMEAELNQLRDEVRSLRAQKGAKLNTSKSALRKELRLSEKDVIFSEDVNEFIVQYLFPRFKFLHDGWMELDSTDRNSFYLVVKRHFPMKDGRVFEDEWSKIMVPIIALKYTQM